MFSTTVEQFLVLFYISCLFIEFVRQYESMSEVSRGIVTKSVDVSYTEVARQSSKLV